MRIARFSLLPATLILLAACDTTEVSRDPVTTSTEDVASVRAEIDRSNQRLTDLISRQQFDSLHLLYTDDAVLLPQNSEPVEGADAIRAWWGNAEELRVSRLELETTDVEVSGDMAVETGRYTLTLQPGTAPAPITDRGNYIVVWKRDDGQWKLHRDIFNTSLPAQQG